VKDAEPQRVRERSKDPIYRDRNHIRSSGFKSQRRLAVNLRGVQRNVVLMPGMASLALFA